MFHRLTRETTDTYNGGNFQYQHFTRVRLGDDWHYENAIYARTPHQARSQIKAQTETVLEWEDK